MFRVLGTPLPTTEEADRQKFVPVWKQEARDELGRKQFHGAFTGGFSAGYHNTVGSREGWAPSTFKSSRDKRASRQQKIEDFMDEEDLRSLHKDTRLVTTELYESSLPSHHSASSDYSARVQLNATRTGIGWEILKRMGWQGTSLEKSPIMALLELNIRKIQSLGDEQRLHSSGFGVSVLEEEEDPLEEHDNAYLPSIETRTKPEIAKNSTTRDYRDQNGIDGFVSASSDFLEENYPPINVPEDFFEQVCPIQTKAAIKKQHNRIMSIEERGNILGEQTKLVSLDLNSPRMRELAEIKLDVATALNAQRGFMPFQSNPDKDVRYRRFLDHFASPNTASLPAKPCSLSQEEYQKELEEFMRAASIFKPLSSLMATKFVPSKTNSLSEITSSKAGLYKPPPREYKPDPSQEGKQSPKEEDTGVHKVEKARISYGKETRTETNWKPASILCKRFNIDQVVASENQPKTNVKPILSAQSVREIVAGSEYADKIDLKALEDDDKEGSETEELIEADIAEDFGTRPAMELFRSIFGDDGEDIESVRETADSQPNQSISQSSYEINDRLSLSKNVAKSSSFSNSGLSTGTRHRGAPLQTKLAKKTLDPAEIVSLEEPINVAGFRPRTRSQVRPVAANSELENGDDDDDAVQIRKKRLTASDFW